MSVGGALMAVGAGAVGGGAPAVALGGMAVTAIFVACCVAAGDAVADDGVAVFVAEPPPHAARMAAAVMSDVMGVIRMDTPSMPALTQGASPPNALT